MFVELHAVEVMHADACISPSEMSKCDLVVKIIDRGDYSELVVPRLAARVSYLG
jgi:hypothetical protein